MKEAMLYTRLEDGRVHCHLCAFRCTIAESRRGVCHVRENRQGTLYTLVYGPLIARHVDPIEKKPLYHFYPGSTAYSIAAPGCNFCCRWCQNAEISQMPREQNIIVGQDVTPQEVVTAAQSADCRSIAYTYTEPTIFFEYIYDTAVLAHQAGLANVLVTNGYMTADMLDQFAPYFDAANVDLKGFRDEVYRKYIGARLQPVLDSLVKIKRLGAWLEVTTLVIPGVNDDLLQLRDAARFLVQQLGPETPWHISRFFPSYKMADVPPTPLALLRRVAEVGHKEGLRYIYVGNVADESNTYCYQCGGAVIYRQNYEVKNCLRPDGSCPHCGVPMDGVGIGGS